MSSALDPFRLTNKLEPSALDVMVARLEARGHHPYFARPLVDYLDRMDIDRMADVLDLGCGTGIAARAIARRPSFKGLVLGIDHSEHLIEAARRFAADEGVGGQARFEVGDSHTLALASASFDAVVAHTLFSHIDDPARVLAEIRRVLCPGGVVGIFDGDFASLTFELGDEERSRRMDDAIVGSLFTNPRILRRLPRLLRQAGLRVESMTPTIIAEVGTADYWKDAVEAFAKLAPRAGLLDEPQAAAWMRELMDASERGEFFGACVYYAYIARAG